MQQLKKVGILGGAIALAACWPLAVGQIAKSLITDQMAKANSDQISITIESYERGYLSSEVTTHVTVVDAELKELLMNDDLPTEITIQHSLKHGLLGISSRSVLADLDTIPAVLLSETQLNGDTDFELTIDPMDIQSSAETGESFSQSKSVISGHVAMSGEVAIDFDFPETRFVLNDGTEFNLMGVNGLIEGKKVNGLWYGEQKIDIAEFAVDTHGYDGSMSAKEVGYHLSSSRTEQGAYDTQHVMQLNDLVLDGEPFWKSLAVDLSIGGFDIEAIESLIELYQTDMYRGGETGVEKITAIGDQLGNRGFNIDLNALELDIAGGNLSSKFDLALPSGLENISQDMMQIIPALVGKLETFVSDEIVAEVSLQEELDEMIATGYVSQVEGGYKVDLTITDGKAVFASGEEIPLLAVLMPLLMGM